MRRAIFLASEVRSGSSYVAECIAYHLNSTHGYSLFGLSKELFRDLNDQSLPEHTLDIYKRLFLDRSGYCSSKLMCNSLSIVVRHSRQSEEVRSAFFGEEAIWLIVRRRDRVKQAVSLAVARKMGSYHHYGDAPETEDQKFNVSVKDIQNALHAVELSDIYLAAFKDLVPSSRLTEIFYEDFLEDESRYVDRICTLLGFNTGSAYQGSGAKLQRVARQQKQELAKKFSFWFLENNHFVSQQSNQSGA